MREVATILVRELNVHTKPGADPDGIVGTVKRGNKFTVLEHHSGPKAHWIMIGPMHWIAIHNNEGAVFAHIDRVPPPDMPDLPIVDPGPYELPWWGWWVLGAVLAVAAIATYLFNP